MGEQADEQGLPATVGSFATDPDSGFEQAYTVTGKGLDQPDPTRIENVVTVLLYDDGDNAQSAFDDLGGDTDNRKLKGNGIYMYGDYCTPQIRGLRYDGTDVEDLGVLTDSGERVLGYGTNAYGDVFFTTVDAVVNGPITDGYVYRVAPQR